MIEQPTPDPSWTIRPDAAPRDSRPGSRDRAVLSPTTRTDVGPAGVAGAVRTWVALAVAAGSVTNVVAGATIVGALVGAAEMVPVAPAGLTRGRTASVATLTAVTPAIATPARGKAHCRRRIGCSTRW